MIRGLLATLILVAFTPATEAQTRANQLFGAMRDAAPLAPQAIGTYAKGCLAGAVQLPETGPTWQAMRLSRNRNWGHPEMIAFIARLGDAAVREAGWAGIYVGDISQPRGGPMTSGHASHQMGLDADIWMLPARRLDLSRSERESISSVNVRSADQTRVTEAFTYGHMALLRAAALDPAVDRIFVTPPVKIAMCNAETGNKDWLQKIRPLQGHNYHFHVRLKCPRDSRGTCETQRPTVRELSNGGNGCDETLNWWVTEYLNPPPPDPNAPPPPPPPPGARDYVLADLPGQCAQVLAAN